MLRFCLIDLKYLFNKKNILGFALTVFVLVLIFNVIYNKIFVNVDDVNYTKSIKQLEAQYYNYVQQRYGYNSKILDTVISLDPVIVITSNFFQVVIALLMLIWFHPFISREIESGIYGRNVVLMGRYKYLWVRFINSVIIIIPALTLMEFLTMAINQNKFIPVNMDKQSPFIIRVLISNSLYLLLVFIFITIISAFAKNRQKALQWSVVILIVNYIILESPAKYISPFFYRDWVFHSNARVFLTQIFVYFVFILTAIAASFFFYRKLDLTAFQERLKC
jgi:hypothetical protein